MSRHNKAIMGDLTLTGLVLASVQGFAGSGLGSAKIASAQ
jgi:hypothetical protein